MARAIGITAAGLVMGLVGLALLTNVWGLGMKWAKFGGALTFMFGGGDALRRPRRVSVIDGLGILVIGVGWLVGGVWLAAH